jgi:hypothetical protein
MVFFTFPEDARWNADREVIEFSVILGPYEGTVRVSRRVRLSARVICSSGRGR